MSYVEFYIYMLIVCMYIFLYVPDSNTDLKTQRKLAATQPNTTMKTENKESQNNWKVGMGLETIFVKKKLDWS